MLNIKNRKNEAARMARNIMQDYGYDLDAASERVLEFCEGQRWMERLVLAEMKRLAQYSQRKAA